MTNKFEQLKNDARTIRMTESEKSLMRSQLESLIQESAPSPSSSPVRSPFTMIMVTRSMAFILIGFITGGGGLAFASEKALPGDILYPVKTEVTEEIVASLQKTPEARIIWEEERINRRKAELAMLDQKGKLRDDLSMIAAAKIEASNIRAEKELAQLSLDISFTSVVSATDAIAEPVSDKQEESPVMIASLPEEESLDQENVALFSMVMIEEEGKEGLSRAAKEAPEGTVTTTTHEEDTSSPKMPSPVKREVREITEVPPVRINRENILSLDFGKATLEEARQALLQAELVEEKKIISDSLLVKAELSLQEKNLKGFLQAIREIKTLIQIESSPE